MAEELAGARHDQSLQTAGAGVEFDVAGIAEALAVPAVDHFLFSEFA